MFLIRHKCRRRRERYLPDAGYYVVNRVAAFGDIEEAAEALVEGIKEQMKRAPQAPTLWDVFTRNAA